MPYKVNVGSSEGIGILGLLGVIFITLKLLEKIHWSWLWVLSPFWIPIGISVLFIIGVLIGGVQKKLK